MSAENNGAHGRPGIAELADAFRAGTLSPVEYTKQTLAEIQRRSSLNAFVTVTPDLALKAAGEAEQRYRAGAELGPLDGVPIALKDVIYTKGVVTTKGCAAYDGFVPEEDAFIVKKLKAAGAVLVGKANTCQFAMGPMGDVSYGGPCRNPYDEQRISGGSSSGCASAVGGGIVPGGIGTDTGGSIRIPSSLCGCVGLKPTFTLVSNEGIMPLAISVDVAGPITRSVRDNAILLGAIAGYNQNDVYSACLPPADYTARIGEPLENTGVAMDPEMFSGDIAPDVRERLLAALKGLAAMGCRTKEISFPDVSGYRAAHQKILLAGGHQEHLRDMAEHRQFIYPQVYGRLVNGAMDADEYIGYEREKNAFRRIMFELMEGCDVLALPSTPIAACRIGEDTVPLNGKQTEVITTYPRYTWIANYSGFPALSIPVGFTGEGMPVGLSLIARPFDEANLYRIAAGVEKCCAGN